MTRWLTLTLAAVLAVPVAPVAGPTVDAAGFRTRIEVVGDLATARRVAVIVPGVGTTADNFDHGLGGVRRRSPAWQARQLYAAAGGARSRIAVVAWLGYQPPSGVGIAAARSERAIEGARALRRYLRGLPGKVVLIGHSYGSLVLAYAARRLPRNVTDLIVLGSPGLDVDSADQLGDDATLWAGQAADDWTRRLPPWRILGFGHGANPAAAGFGARPLDVTAAHGHDGYFAARPVRSLAAVVAGYAARPRLVAAPPGRGRRRPAARPAPAVRLRPLAGLLSAAAAAPARTW